MKSERRHELQHNELADWIGEKVEALKPYGSQIALAIALVALVIAGSVWWFGTEDHASAANWTALFTARNAPRDREKELDNFATAHQGTKPALYAQMVIGDTAAREGSRAMFTDRNEAKKQLERAETAFKAAEAGTQDVELKSRARLGLAKVYESLCKPEEARKYYEMVAASLKDSAIGREAAADAARMKSRDQADLLVWFAAQTPKRPPPFSGMGGTIPGMPNDLPARPDISVPSVTPPSGLGLDNIGTGVPAIPAPDFPTPGATTPGATIPAPTTPTPDAGKTEPSKPDATKTDETPKPEAPKPEVPKPESPKPESPKTEAPKTEAPKSDAAPQP